VRVKRVKSRKSLPDWKDAVVEPATFEAEISE
jgi:hypothetical protein